MQTLLSSLYCLQNDVKRFMTGFELSTKSQLYIWPGLTCSEAAQVFDVFWHMGVLDFD